MRLLTMSPLDHPRLRTFSVHCRERYGHTVGKIPLDVGIICPNRRQGGCLFCRPASFTPYALRRTDSMAEQIRRGKQYLLNGRFRHYFAYFQQETPTALPAELLLSFIDQILNDTDCLGLILSTRPDTLTAELLHALAHLMRDRGKECLIELGLQSGHDRSLAFLNRNHSVADCLDAARLVCAQPGLQLGVHLILGIPGETIADMIKTVAMACAMGVQALKLHHLQVIRETALHELYLQGRVPVFDLEGYLALLLTLLPRIPAHITLHRLWATAHPKLLVAPRWHSHTVDLSAQLLKRMEEQNLWQGKDCGLA